MKPKFNSVEVHPELSNNGHPVDGALMGAGSLWPINATLSALIGPMNPYPLSAWMEMS